MKTKNRTMKQLLKYHNELINYESFICDKMSFPYVLLLLVLNCSNV